MSEAPYKWFDMANAPKDGTLVILYFSVGTNRIPYVARYRKGFIDNNGTLDWESVNPIPSGDPTGWLPIVWKD